MNNYLLLILSLKLAYYTNTYNKVCVVILVVIIIEYKVALDRNNPHFLLIL